MPSETSQSPSTLPASPSTRERVLDAAGQVFAEQGFANATVRDICSLAGANVAAVNYHFGDKQALYSEVLRHTLEIARSRYPIRLAPETSAQDRLRSFVRSFLLRILDQGRPAWHGKLMVREMVEPTVALDMVVETAMRPTWGILLTVVSELLGDAADSERVKRCALSIIGQCVLYRHCRPAILKLYPGEPQDAGAIESIAGHIAEFSLAAIRALTARTPGAPSA